MQLNHDCVRDILLAVEAKKLGKTFSYPQLCRALPKYDHDDIWYCCLKSNEAGFVDINTISTLSSNIPEVYQINELTYLGHEFLDDIRPDTVWEKTKSIAATTGTASLHALKEIAINVVSSIIQNSL